MLLECTFKLASTWHASRTVLCESIVLLTKPNTILCMLHAILFFVHVQTTVYMTAHMTLGSTGYIVNYQKSVLQMLSKILRLVVSMSLESSHSLTMSVMQLQYSQHTVKRCHLYVMAYCSTVKLVTTTLVRRLLYLHGKTNTLAGNNTKTLKIVTLELVTLQIVLEKLMTR
jgi:hypothetical protein